MSKPSTDMKDAVRELDLTMPLERFLAICFLVPMGDPCDPACIWGLPVMLHGSPGIGKTARIHQAARAANLQCKPVELGGRQPEDASGAPFLTRDDKLVIACLLSPVNELNEIGEGVLFLDELTCARPATQGAFLSAVQERRVGDTQFSNHIRIVCAGNPPNEAAGGYQLQLPMANRMAHRDIPPPTVDEYLRHRMQGTNSKVKKLDGDMSKIINEWHNALPMVIGLEAGFLRRFKKHLFTIPPMGKADRGKAFPTPRSLTAAMNAVTTCRILGLDTSHQAELVAACIGNEAAIDWETWVNDADLPDPLDMLNNGWKPDKDRLDRTQAAFSSAVAYTLSRQDKNEQLLLAPKAWNLLKTLTEVGLADIAVPAASDLIQRGYGTKAGKEIAEVARPILLRFGNMGFDDLMREN